MFALALLLAAGTLDNPEKFNGWDVWESTDSMTDVRTKQAFVKSTDGQNELAYFCTDHKTPIIAIFTSRFLGESGMGRNREIILRVDAAEPISRYWKYGDKAANTRFDNETKFVENAFRAGSRLKIRAFTYRNEAVEAEFDITGFDKVLSRVLSGCITR